jgi:hypothetical protein
MTLRRGSRVGVLVRVGAGVDVGSGVFVEVGVGVCVRVAVAARVVVGLDDGDNGGGAATLVAGTDAVEEGSPSSAQPAVAPTARQIKSASARPKDGTCL